MSRFWSLRCCAAVTIIASAYVASSAYADEVAGGAIATSAQPPADNTERIELALRQQTVVECVELPLEEVLTVDLAERHKVPMLIDRVAIGEAGVASEMRVTWTLRGISLASALDLILSQHGLTYMIHDEVLLVTTREAEMARTEARVYNVADLIAGEGSPEALLEVVRIGLDHGRVRRTSAEAGGSRLPGGPVAAPDDAGPSVTVYRDVLVVRDSQHRHRALARLLDEMRAELPERAVAPVLSAP